MADKGEKGRARLSCADANADLNFPVRPAFMYV